MDNFSELEKFILLCENSTPLQFEDNFIKFKTLFDKEVTLEDKEFHIALQLLLKWITFFEFQKISKPKLLLALLLKWDGSSASMEAGDVEGVIGDLAATMMCFQKNLNYIVDVLKDYINILSILDLHIRTRYGTGMVFSLVCDRLLEAFHLENLEDFQWDHLEDTVEETLSASRYDPHFISREMYSETRNNKDVKRYIEYKRKKLLNCIQAKKPEWITEPKTHGVLEETEEVYKSFEFLSSEKVLNQLKEAIHENIKIDPLDVEQIQQLEKITSMAVSLKENVLNQNEEFPSERYYGPTNEIFDQECCGIKGPCRMFYCNCRNEMDYEDTSYLNLDLNSKVKNPQAWFNGTCEECGIGIEKFKYALRFPVKDGGWIGCFCSFECMKKSNIRPYDKETEIRIKEIKETLHKIGIVDF
jgi:hypothetical protein